MLTSGSKLFVATALAACGLAVPASASASGLEILPADTLGDGCVQGRCDPPNGDGDGGSDGHADDGGISITVWGSGTTNGDDGVFEIPAEEVWVLPACRYIPLITGKDYYDLIEDGSWFDEPYDGYEDYADDEDGWWWVGACHSADYDGDPSDYRLYVDGWFDDYPGAVYVEVDDEPPLPPVPPEVLVEVAYDHLELPEPEIDWNPQRNSDAATLVNAETWLWLDDGPISLEVTAEAGGNSASVEATLSEIEFAAPTAAPVTCAGSGTVWAPGAQSDCYLNFERSSVIHGGHATPVTADSHWNVEWFANDEPQGPLDPQTTTAEFTIPVAEVQARTTL